MTHHRTGNDERSHHRRRTPDLFCASAVAALGAAARGPPGSGRTFCVAMRKTSWTSGIPRLLPSLEGLVDPCVARVLTVDGRTRRMRAACSEEYPSRSTSTRAARWRGVTSAGVAARPRASPRRGRRPRLPGSGPPSGAPSPLGDAASGTRSARRGRGSRSGRRSVSISIPPFPQLQERVLHQLLRVLAVPGHEVESLEQALVLLLPQTRQGRRLVIGFPS